MALSNYNGWSGDVRGRRMPAYHKAESMGLFPSKDECLICGQPHDGGRVDYHSEEYGPFPDDYWKHIVALCYRCHGMLHIRHKMPRRWYLYKQYVASVRAGEADLIKPYPEFKHFWGRCMKWNWKDLSDNRGIEDIGETGIPYIDTLGEATREVTKEALVRARWDGDPAQEAIMPDPICYPKLYIPAGWRVEPVGGWPNSDGPQLPPQMVLLT